MKKRILPLLAALALLAGCTGKTSPSGTPTPTPAPAVSSAPAPTPAASGAPGDQGLVWGENFGMEDIDVDSLPTQTAAAPDLWTERLSLVGAVPEADISLYLLNLARPGVLLRQGGEFSYFPLERQFQDLPLLVWRDFDGDGSEELAVRYLMALDPLSEKYGLDGDVLWPRFELHIYGRDGASWSDASFGDAADLRAFLQPLLHLGRPRVHPLRRSSGHPRRQGLAHLGLRLAARHGRGSGRPPHRGPPDLLPL